MQFKPYTYRDHCIANVYTCIAFTSDTIYKYYEIVFPSDLLLNKLFIIIFSNGISMGCGVCYGKGHHYLDTVFLKAIYK